MRHLSHAGEWRTITPAEARAWLPWLPNDIDDDAFVLPGLADIHLHLNHLGSEMSVSPTDCLQHGVTMAFDAGSVGAANAGAFVATVCEPQPLTARFFVNLSMIGLPTGRLPAEYLNASLIDSDAAARAYERFQPWCIGYKVRIEKKVIGGWARIGLTGAIAAANRTGGRVMIHLTDPALPTDEVMALMRPGDIVSHVYHGKGETGLDANGQVRASLQQARERGVIFDIAHGMSHFSIPVATALIEQGFLPDTISTDWTLGTLDRPPAYDLLTVASRLIALGMPENAALEAVSTRPRQLFAHDVGPDARGDGDFAVVAWRPETLELPDSLGARQHLTRRLRLLAAVRQGRRIV